MERFFRDFATALRRHRALTLLLFVGLTLVSGVAALQSRVDNSLAVWQAADDPHWQQYQQFVARYRIIDPLILYLPGLDLLSQEEIADALQKATKIRPAIEWLAPDALPRSTKKTQLLEKAYAQ